jgi:hypothetical protein
MKRLQATIHALAVRVLATILMVAATASAARAQWTVIELHPAGVDESFAWVASPGRQGGSTRTLTVQHAALWSGTASSYVDLNPPGAAASEIVGISAGQQVGSWGDPAFNIHAALWTGTAASCVDLNPAGVRLSYAVGCSGGQQVGTTGDSAFIDHATLWSGTAASAVDLSPAGSTNSKAFGVFGGRQVGRAEFGATTHAVMWSGTAASRTDLHPAGALHSEAHGIDAGQEIGWVTVGPDVVYDVHASLWSGDAASWVDLNPAGCRASYAFAVFGGLQAGSAYEGNRQRACVWSGTAASWVDLHGLLPPRYGYSNAFSIWQDSTGTYVAGAAYDSVTSAERAVLWFRPPPPPLTVLSPAGASASRAYGVAGYQQAGYSFVTGSYRASLWSGTSPTWVDLTPAGATSSFAYGVGDGQQVGSASVGGLELASLWSGTAGSWVSLDPGSGSSRANAVSGGHQVGQAFAGSGPHASLWSGTAGSWVDLNPAGASQSTAWGVSGSEQAGVARIGGADRAGMWSGTASSWVNLAPAGSVTSVAYAIQGGHQVGAANIAGRSHAGLWSGTALSWVDLDPALSTESYAYGVWGSQQVGQATVGGVQRASLWSGSAAEWVDLHARLPAGYTSSSAQGIWNDGMYTYVAGWGHNTVSGHDEALVWTLTDPRLVADLSTPTSVTVETAYDGSGTVVPAQSLPSGSSITLYAIARNAANSFLANVSATEWSLQSPTGGVVAGDLVPSGDSRSAAFTGHAAGSARVRARAGFVSWIQSGTVTVTSVSGVGGPARSPVFALGQNAPNPFAGPTTIRFSIPVAGRVRLRVFDVSGRTVATLVDDDRPAGTYDVRWAGGPRRAGEYFYRLDSCGRYVVRRMLSVR